MGSNPQYHLSLCTARKQTRGKKAGGTRLKSIRKIAMRLTSNSHIGHNRKNNSAQSTGSCHEMVSKMDEKTQNITTNLKDQAPNESKRFDNPSVGGPVSGATE
ncbi:MAG TPA: hypothetical protein VNZ94_04185 [Xanthobacteraceae bacterium]|nr:hypothetical protein [Xanthobacteraceae bacterium]